MTFQAGAEAAVAGHQLLVGHDTDRLENRVQQGRGMALGEDEVVVARLIRVVPVIAEVPADQDSQQVGGGHARGRMPGTGRGARANGVNAQLLSELGGERQVDAGHGGWGGHEYLPGREIWDWSLGGA